MGHPRAGEPEEGRGVVSGAGRAAHVRRIAEDALAAHGRNPRTAAEWCSRRAQRFSLDADRLQREGLNAAAVDYISGVWRDAGLELSGDGNADQVNRFGR